MGHGCSTGFRPQLLRSPNSLYRNALRTSSSSRPRQLDRFFQEKEHFGKTWKHTIAKRETQITSHGMSICLATDPVRSRSLLLPQYKPRLLSVELYRPPQHSLYSTEDRMVDPRQTRDEGLYKPCPGSLLKPAMVGIQSQLRSARACCCLGRPKEVATRVAWVIPRRSQHQWAWFLGRNC